MSAPMDLRHLPPPEPMQRILDALDDLVPGAWLEALTPFRPEPLLLLLSQWGYAWRLEALAEGGARIAIRRQEGEAAPPPGPLGG